MTKMKPRVSATSKGELLQELGNKTCTLAAKVCAGGEEKTS